MGYVQGQPPIRNAYAPPLTIDIPCYIPLVYPS